MHRKHPLVDQCPPFTGDATTCNELVLFGGQWFAPSPSWRRLVGTFGDRLLRTVVFNSSRPITPASVTLEQEPIIHQVCTEAKKELVGAK
jgi:hypothetical protein